MVQPEAAAGFFGIDGTDPRSPLHWVVGIRDIWLGALLAIAVRFDDWRAVTWWLVLAVGVCFADAVIAGLASGRPVSIAFHTLSGIGAAILAELSRREAAQRQEHARRRRQTRRPDR